MQRGVEEALVIGDWMGEDHAGPLRGRARSDQVPERPARKRRRNQNWFDACLSAGRIGSSDKEMRGDEGEPLIALHRCLTDWSSSFFFAIATLCSRSYLSQHYSC